MQHDHASSVGDLVDQMRRPQHRDVVLAHQPAHMLEDVGARLDVEPDGRLVEQQQARAVQQRARDLDAAHLAAGQVAHLVVGAVGQRDPAPAPPSARVRASRVPMPCSAA